MKLIRPPSGSPICCASCANVDCGNPSPSRRHRACAQSFARVRRRISRWREHLCPASTRAMPCRLAMHAGGYGFRLFSLPPMRSGVHR